MENVNSKKVTFEMNGKGYITDLEALNVIRSIVPSAKRAGDTSAVELLMYLGEKTGRIKEMSAAEFALYN